MRHARLLLFCAIAGATAFAIVSKVPTKEPNSVILDSWWNEDYAKSVCASARQNCGTFESSCTDPILQWCQLHDPVAEVRDFEDRLVTHLAVDPECATVHLTRFSGPNGSKSGAAEVEGHWTLFLNYRPGATTQAWELNRKTPQTFTKGEGDPKAIAESVCAIVIRRGANFN
jgi:hypothetical protein